MSNDQGRTIQTVGELKQEINSLPDDAKLSFSSANTGGSQSETEMSGILLQQTEGRVVFSRGGQQSQQGRQSS